MTRYAIGDEQSQCPQVSVDVQLHDLQYQSIVIIKCRGYRYVSMSFLKHIYIYIYIYIYIHSV